MRTSRLALVGLTAVLLSGCAAPAYLDAAPDAADPVCGEVLQALPDEVGDAERRSVSSQATAAWGEPALMLRCGIEPPGPTTDRCITVTGGAGDVDWISVESDDPDFPEEAQRESGSWVFRTYGRVPAIEVLVPVERAGDQPTAPLVDLSAAIEVVEPQRHCVGVTDVY